MYPVFVPFPIFSVNKRYHLSKAACVFQFRRTTGLWYSGEYSSFSVGPETDKYRLSVSGFSGDSGDAIAAPAHPYIIANGMRFSTPDQDNDMHPTRCSVVIGWWFKKCSRSVLNHDTNGVWNAYTTEPTSDVEFARMLVKLG